MNPKVFGFETGDLYVEERISIFSILERVQDPHAEWNNLGIWINDNNFAGVLTVKNNKLVLMPYSEIVTDPTILRAGIRKLNTKFGRQERAFLQDYYKRVYSTPEARANIKIVNRVFQRMDYSDHPMVMTPEYTYTQSGEIRDHRGNPLEPYRANKTKKILTIYGVISSLLSQARVLGLSYDPEIPLSAFNEGDFMDKFLEPVHALKQEPLRRGTNSQNINAEMKAYLKEKGAKEGSDLLNLYYENYYFVQELQNPQPEEISRSIVSVDRAGIKTKHDPNIIREKSLAMQSDSNYKRALRDREIQERLQPRGISYK